MRKDFNISLKQRPSFQHLQEGVFLCSSINIYNTQHHLHNHPHKLICSHNSWSWNVFYATSLWQCVCAAQTLSKQEHQQPPATAVAQPLPNWRCFLPQTGSYISAHKTKGSSVAALESRVLGLRFNFFLTDLLLNFWELYLKLPLEKQNTDTWLFYLLWD